MMISSGVMENNKTIISLHCFFSKKLNIWKVCVEIGKINDTNFFFVFCNPPEIFIETYLFLR